MLLLSKIRKCTICEPFLLHGVRPVFQVSPEAKMLIVGQAPGRVVHESGVPFDDASGDRLRDWMGVDRETFYDASQVAIVPMAFCYPGTGKSGDLPPRKECVSAWREKVLALLENVELTLVIGKYALDFHLPAEVKRRKNLTEVVRAWRELDSSIIALPHPSPRNNIWLKRNEWFAQDLLPDLKQRVEDCLR